jgi:hypothetical protein
MCEVRSARSGSDRLDQVRSAFEAFVAARGLVLTVDRADARRLSYVVAGGASPAGESDRQAIGAWAGSRPDVLVRVDDLMDLQRAG